VVEKFGAFLERHEKILSALLFAAFAALTIPGISWGAPAIWNPDELISHVNDALVRNDFSYFDQTNFDYPSLPKYVMYWLGRMMYHYQFSDAQFIVAARLISVLLGGLVVVMTYWLAKRLGANVFASLFAAGLTLSASAITHNARFAHNDLYLLFFVIVSVHTALNYHASQNRLWLYATFFSVGLAASSKYNGIVLAPVPVILYFIARKKELFKDWLASLETLSIGAALVVGGYVLGTPRALLQMSSYFQKMLPAFFQHSIFGRLPDMPVGFIGQWNVFDYSVGKAVYFLFILAFIWFIFKFFRGLLRRADLKQERLDLVAVVLLAILLFDVPFWFSYNYQERFFISFIPMLAVLAALFVQQLVVLVQPQVGRIVVPSVSLISALMVGYSVLRCVSVMLLFMNDPRIPASDFLETLSVGTSIEFTLYPPRIPANHFSSLHSYPIYITKYTGQGPAPEDGREYNLGEAGLLKRNIDYFVADDFTYARFSNQFLCDNNKVECDFFNKLLAGQTHYTLLKDFPTYHLPSFLPQISISFVNTEIRVYQLKK
jgi:4-amino-4-deoxy-L-arabinose transferase-like glycosyltransferase